MTGLATGIVLVLSLLLGTCFIEFPWPEVPSDPVSERLCAEASAPDDATDTTYIDCRIDGSRFTSTPDAAEEPTELIVMSYNVERGFRVDDQLAAILDDPSVPVPDLLLLSEADRGCRRTQFRDVARDYAQALGYYVVYTTEFVELPGGRGPSGPYDPPLCEHGNAIVSRFPLGNVRSIRHRSNRSWYTPPGFPEPDEPRLGGRVALAADVRVGSRTLRAYSLHLESTLSVLEIRDDQALEIAEDADDVWYPVVVGGDLNTFAAIFTYADTGVAIDGPTAALFDRGFRDPHDVVEWTARPTSFDPVALLLDFVLVRGAETRDPGVCPVSVCGGLSDHLPVWATVDLAACTASDPDCDGWAEDDNCPLRWNPEQDEVCD